MSDSTFSCTLIGGPADGQIVDVPDDVQRIIVPIVDVRDLFTKADGPVENANYHRVGTTHSFVFGE